MKTFEVTLVNVKNEKDIRTVQLDMAPGVDDADICAFAEKENPGWIAVGADLLIEENDD